jgi:hypothetical protein
MSGVFFSPGGNKVCASEDVGLKSIETRRSDFAVA